MITFTLKGGSTVFKLTREFKDWADRPCVVGVTLKGPKIDYVGFRSDVHNFKQVADKPSAMIIIFPKRKRLTESWLRAKFGMNV